ncbi:hypothetical protein VR44_37180, partial [Streptomyces katrae]
MYRSRKRLLATAALWAAASALAAGCGGDGSAHPSGSAPGGGCPAALARAKEAVGRAERTGAGWN